MSNATLHTHMLLTQSPAMRGWVGGTTLPFTSQKGRKWLRVMRDTTPLGGYTSICPFCPTLPLTGVLTGPHLRAYSKEALG